MAEDASFTELARRAKPLLPWLLLAAVVGAAAGLAWSLRTPARYVSTGVLDLGAAPAASASQVMGQLTASFPTPLALAQGLAQQVAGGVIAPALPPATTVGAAVDDKKMTLLLAATSRSPSEAKRAADALVAEGRRLLRERQRAAVQASIRAAITHLSVDSTFVEQNLRSTQAVIARVRPRSVKAAPGTAAALEVFGSDPRVARSQDPADTYLSLQEAQLEVQRSQLQGRVVALRRLVDEPDLLDTLLTQTAAFALVSPPAEPSLPIQRVSLRTTAGGAVLGVMLVLTVALLRETMTPAPAQ